MNPYCRITEFADWHQWQSGYALGLAAKAARVLVSTRFISIPFQRGFWTGYNA